MQELHVWMVLFGIASFLLGSTATAFIFLKKTSAILQIDTSDPEKDLYNFVILCPLQDLSKRKYMTVEIQKVHSRKTQSL